VFGVLPESDIPLCSTPSRYDLDRLFILFCGSHMPLSPLKMRVIFFRKERVLLKGFDQKSEWAG